MSSRIDVELTSKKSDGNWTWRAAGAKEPKGQVSEVLLYDGVKIGDVVKAEVSFELDGIVVESISPPRSRSGHTNKLEFLPKPLQQGITTSPAIKEKRDHRDRDRDRKRPHDRNANANASSATTRSKPTERTPGSRPPQRRSERPQPRSEERSVQKFKRFTPGSKNKESVLATVAPEHQPIAEQLFRGGIPAVRSALAHSNELSRAEGRPETPEELILKIAEDLHVQVKRAIWLDRAEAAVRDAKELGLRDLRSVVASADSAGKDERAKELASQLRAALVERSENVVREWLQDITNSLDESRIIRALRLSSRPPEPTAKFPSELLSRLVEATNLAMSPDTTSDRWITLIEAVASSPVRRLVAPTGLPSVPGDELLAVARESSGKIPALAAMLGITIPPPPRPRNHARPLQRPPKPKRDTNSPTPSTLESPQSQGESGSPITESVVAHPEMSRVEELAVTDKAPDKALLETSTSDSTPLVSEPVLDPPAAELDESDPTKG